MAFRRPEHACWLNEHKALIDFCDQAPAPSKDFYHVFVTQTEFHFRWWKIVPPTRAERNIPPFEVSDTYEEFIDDDKLHSEIQRLAGDKVLNYLLNVAKGELDYLPRMTHPVLVNVMTYLDLEDIARVSQVSKQFQQLCGCNDLWEKIYRMNSETPVTPELEQLAKEQSWKKLFFTNKLQLQVQLRRQAQHGNSDRDQEQLRQQVQQMHLHEQKSDKDQVFLTSH